MVIIAPHRGLPKVTKDQVLEGLLSIEGNRSPTPRSQPPAKRDFADYWGNQPITPENMQMMAGAALPEQYMGRRDSNSQPGSYAKPTDNQYR